MHLLWLVWLGAPWDCGCCGANEYLHVLIHYLPSVRPSKRGEVAEDTVGREVRRPMRLLVWSKIIVDVLFGSPIIRS